MKGAFEVEVVDLSHDGRGVARHQGKAIFVAGALPGETVRVTRQKRRSRHDEAELVEVLLSSPDRVAAPCAHYAHRRCPERAARAPGRRAQKRRPPHGKRARSVGQSWGCVACRSART